MLRKNRNELFLLGFLSLAMFLTLALFFQKQVLQKKAEEKPLSVAFDSLPSQPIKRIWPNFSQGGEEKEAMLAPAKNEITKLQPESIRIDHIFDFSEIVKKDASGNLSFNFANLDKRVDEIVSLGATPFLSLSYFPSALSTNPTEFPPTLDDWQILIQKTIQRYSGKTEKNLPSVYYEVWNEPDLFGDMGPQSYFRLYQVSSLAAQNCQNCNSFKIGGPAITTLKKNWLEEFLTLVAVNHTKLDFISWHSYQLNPAKTLAEALVIKNMANSKNPQSAPELIISESGSKPEISPLHDSYFDASHIVASISLLKDSLDKLFTFELKDGPDPQGQKYWGRWGLLTHQLYGITPKPKYYSFLYLNKLLEFSLNTVEISPGAFAIGSTDGKDNYTIVACRISGDSPVSFNLKFFKLLPGIYLTNIYNLNPLSEPLTPTINQTSFNGGVFNLDLTAYPNAVYLIELARISPAIVKAPGRSGQPNDFSAKLIYSIPPLIFNLNSKQETISGDINFLFKPVWDEQDNLKHTLLETKNSDGDGLKIWTEPKGFNNISLSLGLLNNNEIKDQVQIPLGPLKSTSWHEISLVFDNQKMILSLKFDDQQASLAISSLRPIRIGNSLYIGASSVSLEPAEGAIDDLKIIINNQTLYQNNFD